MGEVQKELPGSQQITGFQQQNDKLSQQAIKQQEPKISVQKHTPEQEGRAGSRLGKEAWELPGPAIKQQEPKKSVQQHAT